MISKFLNTNEGSIIISIILGFGLATLFKKVCKNGRCIIYQGPPIADTKKYSYKMDDICYTYSPYVVACSAKEQE